MEREHMIDKNNVKHGHDNADFGNVSFESKMRC